MPGYGNHTVGKAPRSVEGGEVSYLRCPGCGDFHPNHLPGCRRVGLTPPRSVLDHINACRAGGGT